MSIFADSVPRLTRRKWTNVNQAMQEIASIFLSDDPIVITSPVKIGPTTDDTPPLTITRPQRTDGTFVDPITIVTGGSAVPPLPQPTDQEPLAPSGGGGGNSFLGVIGGQVGGVIYSCTLTGSTGPSFGANVSMQNLDPAAILPSGISVMVVKLGTSYYGLPATFVPFS